MKHFQTMTEAVRAASQLCSGWLVLESGEPVEADAALYLAGVTDRLDHEDDAAAETYYLASDEGAVGVTSRYEYLAQWILIPLPRPMAEIERDVSAELERRRSEQSQGRTEPARFCPWCGFRQKPGAKFCPDCGRRI